MWDIPIQNIKVGHPLTINDNTMFVTYITTKLGIKSER